MHFCFCSRIAQGPPRGAHCLLQPSCELRESFKEVNEGGKRPGCWSRAPRSPVSRPRHSSTMALRPVAGRGTNTGKRRARAWRVRATRSRAGGRRRQEVRAGLLEAVPAAVVVRDLRYTLWPLAWHCTASHGARRKAVEGQQKDVEKQGVEPWTSCKHMRCEAGTLPLSYIPFIVLAVCVIA